MPSEERCAEVLRELRWENGVECVWCGFRNVVKNGSYMQHYQKYMCRVCGRSFNDKTRTIFDYSKMGVREWLYIAKELQKNKSINKISEELGEASTAYPKIWLHSVQPNWLSQIAICLYTFLAGTS